ncbi:MAG: thioredoxin [Clostridiales bacterium]|nr:thioredoxin [Clostridiales bacterium]
MKKIANLEEFNEIIKGEKPVLVDFFAEWCGPCKMQTPILEALEKEITEIDFCKLNVDELEQVAINYGISAIPALFLFKNGEVVAKIIGLNGKEELKNKLEKHI